MSNIVHFEGHTKRDLMKYCINDTYLVNFWAPHCGPCRILAPILQDLTEIQSNNVLMIDTDINGKLTHQLTIYTVPTTLIVQNGSIVKTLNGLHSHEELQQLLNKYKEIK